MQFVEHLCTEMLQSVIIIKMFTAIVRSLKILYKQVPMAMFRLHRRVGTIYVPYILH